MILLNLLWLCAIIVVIVYLEKPHLRVEVVKVYNDPKEIIANLPLERKVSKFLTKSKNLLIKGETIEFETTTYEITELYVILGKKIVVYIKETL